MSGPIGIDGDITQRNDLYGSPFEVVIVRQAWLCDDLREAQKLLRLAGKPIRKLIVYPVQ